MYQIAKDNFPNADATSAKPSSANIQYCTSYDVGYDLQMGFDGCSRSK
jgi:hypothetical protein